MELGCREADKNISSKYFTQRKAEMKKALFWKQVKNDFKSPTGMLKV